MSENTQKTEDDLFVERFHHYMDTDPEFFEAVVNAVHKAITAHEAQKQ